MDYTSRIDVQPLSGTAVPDHSGVELRAPVKVAGERPHRDRLSIAWTAMFAAYAAVVLPLLGWSVVQAL
jgi:hypothetical protein